MGAFTVWYRDSFTSFIFFVLDIWLRPPWALCKVEVVVDCSGKTWNCPGTYTVRSKSVIKAWQRDLQDKTTRAVGLLLNSTVTVDFTQTVQRTRSLASEWPTNRQTTNNKLSRSNAEEIHLLWNPTVHYRVHMTPLLKRILIQFNPIHIPHPIPWWLILLLLLSFYDPVF
jgi:hypothetical protein